MSTGTAKLTGKLQQQGCPLLRGGPGPLAPLRVLPPAPKEARRPGVSNQSKKQSLSQFSPADRPCRPLKTLKHVQYPCLHHTWSSQSCTTEQYCFKRPDGHCDCGYVLVVSKAAEASTQSVRAWIASHGMFSHCSQPKMTCWATHSTWQHPVSTGPQARSHLT